MDLDDLDLDLNALLELLGPDGASPIERMRRAQWVITVAQNDQRAAIREARTTGDSWAKIGEALGMSRQAAHERFGHEPDVDLPER